MRPVDLTQRIVHHDGRLMVMDKPSGMPAVRDATPGEDVSLHAWVAAHVGGAAFVVHRLDRGTSGLIVFALDREAHRRLSMAFESRQVRKAYLALVLGHLEEADGEVDLPLRIFGSGRVAVDPRGRPARTRYRRIEHLPAADLVEATPETGRRHQIRAHLHNLGHPIVGDPRYGERRPVGGAARLMLHAAELVLPALDDEGEVLSFAVRPGPDFDEIVERWREPADAG